VSPTEAVTTAAVAAAAATKSSGRMRARALCRRSRRALRIQLSVEVEFSLLLRTYAWSHVQASSILRVHVRVQSSDGQRTYEEGGGLDHHVSTTTCTRGSDAPFKGAFVMGLAMATGNLSHITAVACKFSDIISDASSIRKQRDAEEMKRKVTAIQSLKLVSSI